MIFHSRQGDHTTVVGSSPPCWGRLPAAQPPCQCPCRPRAMISTELLHSPIIRAAAICTALVRSTGLVSPTRNCQCRNNTTSSFLIQLSQGPLQAADGCWPSSFRSSWRCWSSRCWFGPTKVLRCQVSGALQGLLSSASGCDLSGKPWPCWKPMRERGACDR